jgi:c-di-GMP-related signal transduction protein
MEYIARQPLLDLRQNVVAYELLFRESYENPKNATRAKIKICLRK